MYGMQFFGFGFHVVCSSLQFLERSLAMPIDLIWRALHPRTEDSQPLSGGQVESSLKAEGGNQESNADRHTSCMQQASKKSGRACVWAQP